MSTAGFNAEPATKVTELKKAFCCIRGCKENCKKPPVKRQQKTKQKTGPMSPSLDCPALGPAILVVCCVLFTKECGPYVPKLGLPSHRACLFLFFILFFISVFDEKRSIQESEKRTPQGDPSVA